MDDLDEPDDQPDDQPETRPDDLGRLLGRLDILDAFDDLGAGGAVGLATGVEIFTDSFTHGPADLLDAFEPVRDLADHTDLFDDLF